MDSPILCKVITTNTQVTTKPCYLIGASLEHTGTTDLEIYDEDNNTGTAARQVIALKGSNTVSLIFPLPGVKCCAIYAKYFAGSGRVYYRLI